LEPPGPAKPGAETLVYFSYTQSYLIFAALRRPDGVGGYDLYLSRKQQGQWGRARPLGERINSPASEWNHSVSPDEKWLHFSSNRPLVGGMGERLDFPRDGSAIRGIGNGKGDIYRVRMSGLGL